MRAELCYGRAEGGKKRKASQWGEKKVWASLMYFCFTADLGNGNLQLTRAQFPLLPVRAQIWRGCLGGDNTFFVSFFILFSFFFFKYRLKLQCKSSCRSARGPELGGPPEVNPIQGPVLNTVRDNPISSSFSLSIIGSHSALSVPDRAKQ